MGVGRESVRSVISKNIQDLNDINEILSSDTDHLSQSVTGEAKRLRRKKRCSFPKSQGSIYNCRKSNDFFLKELASELGIDSELQDMTPQYYSPLSSLFDDPDKMRIWLVFIDSAEDVQDRMLKPSPEVDCNKRYHKISSVVRQELDNVPSTTIKKFEDVIYGAVSTLGYNSVVVLSATTVTDRVAIVAVSQYSRLKTCSHRPINVIEVVSKGKNFKKPSIPLSKLIGTK